MKALIILLSAFTLISATTFAQTEKGRLRLGGSLSASHIRSETEYTNPSRSYEFKQTNISLSPSGGVFLLDGFEAGLAPAIISSLSTNDSEFYGSSDRKTLNISIGPYINYYIGAGEKGKPYVGAQAAIGRGRSTEEIYEPFSGDTWVVDADTKSFSVSIVAGYALFLNDAYILSFYGGYTHSKNTYDRENQYEEESKAGMFTVGVAISTTFKRNQ